MRYLIPKAYTVPPSSRIEDTVTLEGTSLKRFELVYPPGPAFLLKVRVFYGIKQILPWREDTWLQGNDEVIAIDDVFEFPERVVNLKIEISNEDEVYEHTCLMRFIVEDAKPKAKIAITSEGMVEIYV